MHFDGRTLNVRSLNTVHLAHFGFAVVFGLPKDCPPQLVSCFAETCGAKACQGPCLMHGLLCLR